MLIREEATPPSTRPALRLAAAAGSLPQGTAPAPIVRRLSTLERFCPLRIFAAMGNHFAIAVATFGIGSGEALAAVVGPLMEMPALVGVVHVAVWARRPYFPADTHPELEVA